MSLDLVSSTIVIAAHHFNPSIVRDHWLIEHGILDAAEDLQEGYVFTDMLVQLRSRRFNLFVVPAQCQFTPHVELGEQQTLIEEKVGRIVRTLPQTPYTAIGLNFHWHIAPENTTIEMLSRKLFFVPDSPLHREFQSRNARFGGYLSQDAFGFRMRLDVKPVIKKNEEEGSHMIQLAFNFDLKLSEDSEERVPAIERALQNWNSAHDESLRIAKAAAIGDEE